MSEKAMRWNLGTHNDFIATTHKLVLPVYEIVNLAP